MKVKLQVAAIALMAVLAAVTPLTAKADLLPNTASYTPDVSLGVTEVTKLFTASATITTTSFKVDVYQEVWQNSAGTIDFFYQVKNVVTPGKTGVIHRVTMECFEGHRIPKAGWLDSLAGSAFVAGTEDPGNVTRDGGPLGGETVGFEDFPVNGSGVAGISPGEISKILFIRSDVKNPANLEVPGGDASVGIINGHPGFSNSFYSPTCVPEPAMVQLSSLAGLGFLGLLRFRKRKA